MPRNADPGLEATYSKPRVLMTSTMKSEPGRSVVQTSTWGGGAVSDAVCLAPGRRSGGAMNFRRFLRFRGLGFHDQCGGSAGGSRGGALQEAATVN